MIFIKRRSNIIIVYDWIVKVLNKLGVKDNFFNLIKMIKEKIDYMFFLKKIISYECFLRFFI